uniref:Uncharacterized protein n=1 Tax=Anguilla anguilla TaxID=7936 RepID=A0A0E9PZT8_ANGAN
MLVLFFFRYQMISV